MRQASPAAVAWLALLGAQCPFLRFSQQCKRAGSPGEGPTWRECRSSSISTAGPTPFDSALLVILVLLTGRSCVRAIGRTRPAQRVAQALPDGPWPSSMWVHHAAAGAQRDQAARRLPLPHTCCPVLAARLDIKFVISPVKESWPLGRPPCRRFTVQ